MKRLRRGAVRGRSGSVELPLRLLVALVVLGIVLPIVFGLFTGYSRLDAHRAITDGVNRLFTDAQQVSLGGNGTTRTASILIPSGPFGAVQFVAIGDSLHGSGVNTARYRLTGEPTSTIVMGAPSVRMTNARNEPLLLSAGRHDLLVRHWITKDFAFVVVDREGVETEYGRFDVDYPQRQPDLVVSDLRLTPSNSAQIEYVVANIGDADAPPFDMNVLVDGETVASDRLQLAAGQEHHVSREIPVVPPAFVEVIADAGNTASEISGFNNALRTRYEVATPAFARESEPGRSAACDAQSTANPFNALFYHNIGWALVNTDSDPMEQVPATDGSTVWGHPKHLYGTVSRMARPFDGSIVSHTDLPNTHDSHDETFRVELDEPFRYLAGVNNTPGVLEVEWETLYYPQWAWPSQGDRVWVFGQWIHDCGHPEPNATSPLYKTEIHPAMAVAAMRKKADTFDGQTFVPTTEVDVWINGDGGFVKDVLQCGTMPALRGECRGRVYSVNRVLNFTVPLPPRPAGEPELVYEISGPPGASIEGTTTVSGGISNAFVQIEVREDIPQGGTIRFAWRTVPDPPLPRFRLTVECILLKYDEDPIGDAEVFYAPAVPQTHFWINLNRAYLNPGTGRWHEWTHLGQFAHEFYENVNPQNCSGGTRTTGNDGSLLGDWASGRALKFQNAGGQPSAVYEFSVPPSHDFAFVATGWDSDGCDDAYGQHTPTIPLACVQGGDNDFLGYALVRFLPSNAYACPRSQVLPPCSDFLDSTWRGKGISSDMDPTGSDFTVYYKLEKIL